MRAPGAWRAAPPALPPACRVPAGRLGGGGPGQPTGCHAREGRGATRGLFAWGGGRRRGRLRGALARVDDPHTERCHGETPGRGRHGPATADALPRPAARRRLTGPPRFGEPEGPPPRGGPPAAPSWRTAPVRGTHVMRPTRCSRPPPRVCFPSACLSAPRPRPPSRPRATPAAIATGVAVLARVLPSRRPRRRGRPSLRPPRLRRTCWSASRPAWRGPEAGRGGTSPSRGRAAASSAPSRRSVVVS